MTESEGIEVETASAPKSGAAEQRFVREDGAAGRLAALAEPVIEGLGYRLVRIVISGRDGGTVQIMAERPDGTIAVEDCAQISRNLGPVIEANDPIQGSYRLEVSSPGIDRPLVRASDFAAWAGHEARIELKAPVDGRRRFRGLIEGFANGEARILVEDEAEAKPIGLKIELIESARLVMTEALVRATLKSAAQHKGKGKSKAGRAPNPHRGKSVK